MNSKTLCHNYYEIHMKKKNIRKYHNILERSLRVYTFTLAGEASIVVVITDVIVVVVVVVVVSWAMHT